MGKLISLRDYQLDAVKRMHNGCILCGGVGSGKSRTALAYYYILNGGDLESRDYTEMKKPCDLYIITTAQKRDTLEWDGELCPFLMAVKPEVNHYKNKVVIDSWNNIKKYVGVKDAFFLFDEQHVIRYGAWTQAFLRITRQNRWILLTATPGDCWEDYAPVFIANGFYKSITEFRREHLVYSQRVKFPKVERYIGVGRLTRLRDRILVDMDFHRGTVQHHEDVYCAYDRILYKSIMRDRWDIWNNEPLKNGSAYCYALRKLVNSDEARQTALLDILEKHPRAIVFYNFDYERDILKSLPYTKGTEIAEWNGHIHQGVPDEERWIYLVQYTAGSEGWNCIKTDTIVFFSQNYSWRVLEQACGRIDRLNTPFTDLYFYHIKSRSSIDLSIARSLREKKDFNAARFARSQNFTPREGGGQ
jgi:hypothetical protein